MKDRQKSFYPAFCFLAAFFLWTIAVKFVDVQNIGPQNSTVGFAALNGAFHRLTGVNMALYAITDWLGLVPLGFVMTFGLQGLVQWIRRKKLSRVDPDLRLLGVYYLVVLAIFLLFERVVINYRPILINNVLEPSYPSSTTMLVLCVMPTVLMQLHRRASNTIWRHIATYMIVAFSAFMVIGRLLSGVHWLTDIIGGILLSTGLMLSYKSIRKYHRCSGSWHGK